MPLLPTFNLELADELPIGHKFGKDVRPAYGPFNKGWGPTVPEGKGSIANPEGSPCQLQNMCWKRATTLALAGEEEEDRRITDVDLHYSVVKGDNASILFYSGDDNNCFTGGDKAPHALAGGERYGDTFSVVHHKVLVDSDDKVVGHEDTDADPVMFHFQGSSRGQLTGSYEHMMNNKEKPVLVVGRFYGGGGKSSAKRKRCEEEQGYKFSNKSVDDLSFMYLGSARVLAHTNGQEGNGPAFVLHMNKLNRKNWEVHRAHLRL